MDPLRRWILRKLRMTILGFDMVWTRPSHLPGGLFPVLQLTRFFSVPATIDIF